MMEPIADIVLAKGGNENESASLYDHWLPGLYGRLLYCPVFQLHHLKGAGSAADPAKGTGAAAPRQSNFILQGPGSLTFGRQVTGAWPGSPPRPRAGARDLVPDCRNSRLI